MSSLSYPLRIVNGAPVLVSDPVDIIGQAILSTLKTVELERVLRPYYGRGRVLFTTVRNLSRLLIEVRQTIETGLVGYETVDLSVMGRYKESDGALWLTVTYAVVGSQITGSLSFSLDQLFRPSS
jgi:phage baseplate assembly protein W